MNVSTHGRRPHREGASADSPLPNRAALALTQRLPQPLAALPLQVASRVVDTNLDGSKLQRFPELYQLILENLERHRLTVFMGSCEGGSAEAAGRGSSLGARGLYRLVGDGFRVGG